MQAKKRKLGLLESENMDKDDESEKSDTEEAPVVAKIQGNFNLIWFGFLLRLFLHCMYFHLLMFSQIILKDHSTRNW